MKKNKHYNAINYALSSSLRADLKFYYIIFSYIITKKRKEKNVYYARNTLHKLLIFEVM